MQMYQRYSLKDVLALPAKTFFILLLEGRRIQNRNYLRLAHITFMQNGAPQEREKFIKQLQWSTQSASDIVKPSDDYTGLEQVEQLFKRL